MMINAGIARLVVAQDYPDRLSEAMLKEADIALSVMDLRNFEKF